MQNTKEIDDIISVELPLPTDDPMGYKAVTDYMLHDPYGKDARYAPCNVEGKCSKHFPKDTRYAPCNVEGKCSKHFPKPIYEETIIDQDGYHIYRRRDNKPITLRDSDNLPALLEREGVNITMFTNWFALNERHPLSMARTNVEIL
nr:hypothetical protein [Tanacetum cinerariifolium]